MIDMTRVAPSQVKKEAKLGLMLHKKWKRGGTAVGVARAVQLSSGKTISDQTIKRMYSYFQRHQHDRLDKDGSDGSIPGRGYIAWLLWGGDAGRRWAESEYKKLHGKKKNPIKKPIASVKKELAKKSIFLIKVTLNEFRSEPWAQDMVTKEEDFEVVDNYTDSGEPIFKTSEYVLAVLPKEYLQDFDFCRKMQMEGKLEKLSFSSACRAWLDNDQPLDWFNEQVHDRGYIDSNEYLFLVKVNNPAVKPGGKSFKQSNPARNILNPEAIKKHAEGLIKTLEAADIEDKKLQNIKKWMLSNYVKGIINSDYTERILFLIKNEQDKQSIKYYFFKNKQIPDWITKAFENDEKIYIFPEEDKGFGDLDDLFERITDIDFNHFIDFIKTSNFPNDPSRVSFDQMRELVRRWDEEDVKIKDENKIQEGEKLYKEYADGMKWVLLTNKEAMQNESRISRMNHCIGRIDEQTGTNDYIRLVTEGKRKQGVSFEGFAFSLRDNKNNPYATAFYVVEDRGDLKITGYFNQIKGYSNCNINTATYNQVDKEIRKGIQDRDCEELGQINSNEKYVVDLLRDVKRLKQFTGSDFDLERTVSQESDFLDDALLNLIVTELSKLSDYNFYIFTNEELSSNKKIKFKNDNERIIKHYFNENINSLKALPTDFAIIQDLYLSGFTSLKELPAGLKLVGGLYLSGCTSLKELPADLKVGLDLNLNDCISLKELPADLKVGGRLYLYGCTSLKELPAGLKVGRDLTLNYCTSLKELPAGLKVGGSLYLSDCTSLKELPAGLKVGGDIYLPDHLEKKKNPTKEEEVEATKEYLLELAKECGKRPSKNTVLGMKLSNYLISDKSFKQKIKELCPDWFYQSSGIREKTKAAMEMFLEMARRGEKRPSHTSKDPKEKKLAGQIRDLFYKYPEFEENIYQANKEWTNRGQAEVVRETKNYLVELARECGTRPQVNTNLGNKLHNYLLQDKGFKQKIKELCPDWFRSSGYGPREETIAAMEMFLEMARNGEKRPSQTSKDPKEKKLGVLLTALLVNYPDFRKKVLEANRDWFLSEERKQFLSEYKEENPLSLIARGIDERPASAYDRKELKLGIKTELEHTDDAIIASKIAKDHLDEDPHYYSKLIEMESKMKNPITSSHEKSEEYLPVIQDTVSKLNDKTDVWIDENSGDILVGTMAFEEDRSFDDVLIRIKTNGQIKEGESVDDSIRKYTQNLMKKIHKDLAEYVTKKPNPSKEISEIKTNIKKLNKFFGFKKRNPNEKDIPYLSETLLSSDILLEYLILSIIKASGNSGAPLILIEKSVFEILMGGQEISEAGKGLNESAKDKLETSLYVKIMRMINEWKRKKLNFIYERSPAKENELYSLLQKRPSDSKYYVIESDGIQYLNSIKLVIQQIIDKEEKIKDQQSIIELLSSYREKIIKMKNKGISRKIPEIDKVQEIVEEKIESKKPNPVAAGVDPEEFDDLVKKLKKRKDVDNPYALANWILKQKNPTRYEKLVKQLEAKGAEDPKALAAWIGRQKYGKEGFQKLAAAGRKKKKSR